MTQPSINTILLAAWDITCPAHAEVRRRSREQKAKEFAFPDGPWPNIARLAAELARDAELTPEALEAKVLEAIEFYQQDWRNMPELVEESRPKPRLAARTKADLTAQMLDALLGAKR